MGVRQRCGLSGEECEFIRIERSAHLQLIRELQHDYDVIWHELEIAIQRAEQAESKLKADEFTEMSPGSNIPDRAH